jgi:hypothetical protein
MVLLPAHVGVQPVQLRDPIALLKHCLVPKTEQCTRKCASSKSAAAATAINRTTTTTVTVIGSVRVSVAGIESNHLIALAIAPIGLGNKPAEARSALGTG